MNNTQYTDMADNLNESTHSSEHGEEDMIVKKLKDPDLWIRVKVTRNIKVTNIEMAQAVYASVTLNNPGVIVPNDILATQYHSDDGVWFITMSTKAAKMHVLANNVITVKDKTFAVEDYSTVNRIRKKKWIRLSIHELPQSLSNKYVEEWVDTFAKRETPVKRHKEEDRKRHQEDDEIAQRFSHIYTGHRYCYVSQIYEHKDRYSDMQIPDPRNERDLVPTQVVLYYNGQPPINCHFCYLDHPAKNCPDRPVLKCFLCNSVGHSKYNCPTADLGPTCFKCNRRGHMKNDCDQNTVSPTSTHSSEKPKDQSSSTTGTQSDQATLNQDQIHSSVNVLHELLDKCMLPSSGPSSPDLMKKVEELLISAKESQSCNKEVQNTSELTEESAEEGSLVSNQNKASKAKMKQSDIRKHLSGATSRSTQDDSENEQSEKKKSMKGRKKRNISTSPKDQNESKKGRQDDEESGTVTEYESPNSSGSESGGSYNPP